MMLILSTMLQETWLSSQTEHRIRNVHQDYMFTCMSAMGTREAIVQGRPYGGVAIMWKRSLTHCITPIKSTNKRISAVLMECGSIKLVLVCVYLPCDNWSNTKENPEYVECVDYVSRLKNKIVMLLLLGEISTLIFPEIILKQDIYVILIRQMV